MICRRRKHYSIIVGLIIILSFVIGCGEKTEESEEAKQNKTNDHISSEIVENTDVTNEVQENIDEKKIITNTKKYIEESNLYAKGKIDYSIYRVEDFKKYKEIQGDNISITLLDEDGGVNDNDLLLTVGDTSDHDFAILLMDGETLEIKGISPIK